MTDSIIHSVSILDISSLTCSQIIPDWDYAYP